MDIGQALKDLDATGNALPEHHRAELDEKGYTVLPGVMDEQWLGALRERFESLCEAEGIAAGIEVHQEEGTRRLADLVNKGPVFDLVYTHPTVLAAIHHVIGREFKMSSLNARDALPGEGHQGLHSDWSKDYDGRFHVCNSIWLLDDFTEENGCTRLVPGTHRGKHPGNVLKDPEAPHPEEEHLVAPAGTVAVFNSHIVARRHSEPDQGRQASRAALLLTLRVEHPQQLRSARVYPLRYVEAHLQGRAVHTRRGH